MGVEEHGLGKDGVDHDSWGNDEVNKPSDKEILERPALEQIFDGEGSNRSLAYNGIIDPFLL
jgi:hypothetical protein